MNKPFTTQFVFVVESKFMVGSVVMVCTVMQGANSCFPAYEGWGKEEKKMEKNMRKLEVDFPNVDPALYAIFFFRF